jgi:malonate-semialdehyde dehydrogenase (acetylating) / methylmalonate-semialdehyde dehydrogenase
VTRLIASAEAEGGRVLLDGRGVEVPGYSDGNFVGPTILEANTSMRCYKWVFKFVILYHQHS